MRCVQIVESIFYLQAVGSIVLENLQNHGINDTEILRSAQDDKARWSLILLELLISWFRVLPRSMGYLKCIGPKSRSFMSGCQSYAHPRLEAQIKQYHLHFKA